MKPEEKIKYVKDNIDAEAMRETMKDIEKLSELIKDVVPVYNFAKPHEKEKIIRIIFSELYVSQDVLQYKVKKGFEAFEDRLVAICDPNGTELEPTSRRVKTMGQLWCGGPRICFLTA